MSNKIRTRTYIFCINTLLRKKKKRQLTWIDALLTQITGFHENTEIL